VRSFLEFRLQRRMSDILAARWLPLAEGWLYSKEQKKP
jgi:hypothetical protein